MKSFEAGIVINAAPSRIWSILTDAARYPEWDPGVVRIEGNIAPGERLRIFTKLSPGRAFPVRVENFTPNTSMVWSGGMPLGLFKGVRTFTLTPAGAGATRVEIDEHFTGLLLPLIGRTLPDMNVVFRDFLAALKQRAESKDQ